MSMNWYKVSFTEEDVVAGRVQQLASQMNAAVTALGDPQTDALLVDSVGRKGGADEVFFSPDAAKLAPALIAEYEAVPCTAPRPNEVGLLVGRIPGYSRFKGVTPPQMRYSSNRKPGY
jgi:hypothetical protein